MVIAIGSTNKTKIQAAKNAIDSKFIKAKVVSVDVETGVSEQPMSDDETRNGAENRARAALNATSSADLGMGLEGGVQKSNHGLLNSVWCCVVDREGNVFYANGERFYLPHTIAEKILAGGEMGPVLAELMDEPDIKYGRGMIGAVTENYMNRSEAYGHLAKIAIGLWYGRNWEMKNDR